MKTTAPREVIAIIDRFGNYDGQGAPMAIVETPPGWTDLQTYHSWLELHGHNNSYAMFCYEVSKLPEKK